MRLNEALKEKLLDLRVRDRLLAEGKITQKEIEQYLNELEDAEVNAEYFNPYETEKKEAPEA